MLRFDASYIFFDLYMFICFMFSRFFMSVMPVLGREGERGNKERSGEPGLLHNQTYNGL